MDAQNKSYKNTGMVVTISKLFLEDQLGERDWNNEVFVTGLKTVHGDVVFRLRGKSKTMEDSYEYNVMELDDSDS